MSNIYDLIQQKANNHEDPVPSDAWENIKKKKGKKRPGFFWMLPALLLCGLLIGGYFYFNRNTVIANKDSISQADQLHAQPNNINNNIQKKSNEPGQPANPNMIATKETTGTNADISGNNNQQIQNSTSLNKQDQQAGNNVQQSSKKYLYHTGNTGNKKIAPVHNSYDNVLTGESNDHPATAARKKIVKKQGARSLINISQSETGELANNQKDKKDSPSMVPAETGNNRKDELTGNKEKTTTLSPTLPAEKNIVTEPVQQKTVATTINENKKQDKPVKKSGSKHPWFIDVAITPVIPVQQYDPNIFFTRSLVAYKNKADFTGQMEHSRIDPSVAYSLSLGRDINKKFSASIGLQYLQLKEHVSITGTQTNTYYDYITKQVMLDEGPGVVIDTIKVILKGDRKFSAINSYRFLSIPVYLQYKIIQQRRWSLAFTAGVNVNVYSRYNNSIDPKAAAVWVNTSQTIPATTSISYALVGGIRIDRMISKQLSIFANPAFSYIVGKQEIKSSLFNTKIHQLGIGLGLSYKLK